MASFQTAFLNKYATASSKVTPLNIYRVLLLIVGGTAIGLFMYIILRTSSEQKYPFCTSFECVKEARYLLSAMNLSANPCDDFYNYVCGNVNKHYTPEPGTPSMSVRAFIRLQFHTQIYGRLRDKTLKEKINSTALWKVQEFYESCADMSPYQDLDFSPVTELIEKTGGWTIIPSPAFDMSSWKVLDSDAVAAKLTFPTFIELKWRIHPFNVSSKILSIERAKAIRLFLDPANAEIKTFTLNLAKLMGNPSDVTVSKKLADIADMLNNLNNRIKSFTGNKSTGKIWTISELQNEISAYEIKNGVSSSNFNLLNYVRKVMRYNVSESELVAITEYGVSFLKALAILDGTKKEELGNYISLSLIRKILMNSPRFLFKGVPKENITVGMDMNYRPKWLKCVETTMAEFSLPIAKMHTEFYGSKKETIQNIIKLSNKMKKGFVQLIKSSSFSAETKQHAIEKINNIIDIIGYPPHVLDTTLAALDKMYETIAFNKSAFHRNYLKILDFNQKLYVEKFRTPYRRSDLSGHLMVTNILSTDAFFVHARHVMVLLAGQTEPPMFSNHFTKLSNLAALGYVIGHELSHTFFPTRRADGGVGPWWSGREDQLQLENTKKCLLQQYAKYYRNGTIGPPVNAINEIMSDNSGLQLSFEILQTLLPSSPSEMISAYSAFKMTQSQLFFIANTRPVCVTDYKEIQINVQSSHPPPHVRVFGRMANSKAFAKAFNCPLNSPYNPVEKCVIW